MAQVQVSREWLEDAMTASGEFAWVLSILMDSLDRAPEEVRDVLDALHQACEAQQEDIAGKLGIRLPSMPPPQPKKAPSYLRLVVSEESSS